MVEWELSPELSVKSEGVRVEVNVSGEWTLSPTPSPHIAISIVNDIVGISLTVHQIYIALAI